MPMASMEVALAGRERLLDDISSAARVALKACRRIGDTSRGMAYSCISIFASAPVFGMFLAKGDTKFLMAGAALAGIGELGMANSLYNCAVTMKDIWVLKKGAKEMHQVELDRDTLGSSVYNLANEQRNGLSDRVGELRKISGKLYEYTLIGVAGDMAVGASAYFADKYKLHPDYNSVAISFYAFTFGTVTLISNFFAGMSLDRRAEHAADEFRNMVRSREGIGALSES